MPGELPSLSLTPSVTSEGATRSPTPSPPESPVITPTPTTVAGPLGSSYTMEYGPKRTILSDEVLTTKRVRKQRHLGLLTTITDLSGFTLGLNQALFFAFKQRKILVSSLPPPPKHWKAMLKHPRHQGFLEATQKEHNRIASQGTFEPVASLPKGHKATPPRQSLQYGFRPTSRILLGFWCHTKRV